MPNQKVTLRCPIRKSHRKLQAKPRYFCRFSFGLWSCHCFHFHRMMPLFPLSSVVEVVKQHHQSPHPSSKSPKTDNCCFNSISLLPFHLCLLKISKAMSISSWRKMSLSRPMRWWMVSLVLWEYGAKVGETLKQGEEGGWPLCHCLISNKGTSRKS